MTDSTQQRTGYDGQSPEPLPPVFAATAGPAMMISMQRSSGQRGQDDQAIPHPVWPVEDRGSFTHGVCRSCSWTGSGRRSRGVAASDAELHALAGCENTDTP